MMYKTLLKLVFITLLATIAAKTAFAQKEYIYHFDTSKTVLPPVFYNKVRVVDNRGEKQNIGFIQTQKAFSKVEQHDMLTQSKFDLDFKRYIEKFLADPGDSGDSERELLLVLYDFRAENKIMRSTFYLKMEAFAKISETYKMVASVDTIYERKHDRPDPSMKMLVSDNVFDLMSGILSINPGNIKKSDTYTSREAQERIADIRKRYPIYSQPAKEGLYKSYEQFLENKPESLSIKKVEKVIITESLTHYYVYVESDNSRKGKRVDAEDYFAVHYNDVWYISDGKKFSVMTFENGDFYTQSWMKKAYSVVYRYTAVGGLVTVWTAPEKEEKSWGTYKMRLAPEKGKLLPTKRIK